MADSETTDMRSPFHRGEREIQARLGVRDRLESLGRRVIRDHMPEEHREFFAQLPVFLVGTVDAAGRPWASVLAGEPGFLDPVDERTLKVRARPIFGDPLGKALVEGAAVRLDQCPQLRELVAGQGAHGHRLRPPVLRLGPQVAQRRRVLGL